MNRGAVSAIAIAVMFVSAFVAMSDPTRNGQFLAMGLGLLACVIVFLGIISGASDWGSSTRGDTSQVVNLYVAPPTGCAATSRAAGRLYPMPQPGYLPGPAYASQPHALPPGYAQPAYLPAPGAEYRGALDVVAEPVPYALGHQPQPQIPRGPGRPTGIAEGAVRVADG